jgi:hypothetical protein
MLRGCPVGRAKNVGFRIQKEKFDRRVRATGKSRAAICSSANVDDNNAGVRIARGTAFPYDEVERIAQALGCAITDFAIPIVAPDAGPVAKSGRGAPLTNRSLKIFESADIEKRYATFGATDFVMVFSLDGFLEANLRRFRESVFSAISRGLEVFYLFPDSEVAGLSAAQFELIAGFAHKEGLRVRGYLVDACNRYVATRAARFVLIGRKSPDGVRLVNEILLYVHSKQDYWIHLDLTEHIDFVTELQSAIDPIPYMPVRIWKERWHLPPIVQEKYQTSFTQASKVYSSVRRVAETRQSAERVATRAVEHLLNAGFDREGEVIRWLDIGCENGENTDIVHKYLKQHHFNVALTAIDTSWQTEVKPLLRHCTFLHGKRWTFESFAETFPRAHKFDLITSLHSWYVIDPIYLVEAYRRLSARGALVVTMGPYAANHDHRGNFINVATGVIDALVADGANLVPMDDVYLGKVIRSDPYRNYGEDIVEACRSFFGIPDMDFFVQSYERPIAAASVLDEGGLTPSGRDIIRFFAHDLPVPGGEEVLFAKVFDALTDLVIDGMLPAAEIDVIVDRSTITRRQRDKLRLEAREASG